MRFDLVAIVSCFIPNFLTMKKTINITYGLLILLTLTTAVVSNLMAVSKVAVFIIMTISAIKFLLVSFQFMELKEAHSFWKFVLAFVLVLIIISVLLLC